MAYRRIAAPRSPSLRTRAAVVAGKLAVLVARAGGRGGTALPGLVAERLAPDVASRLAARLDRGVVVVTGTNGKTTTASMLAHLLRAGGLTPVHNRAGSNLMRGLSTTLVSAAGWDGALAGGPRAIGVFEVDEAVAPRAADAFAPRVMVITNLFRDQLDRYAELAVVADIWRRAIATMRGATLVLNADDPLVGALPTPPEGRRVLFGVADPSVAGRAGQTADSIWCPQCGERLAFTRVWFGHLGEYHCPACGYARPPLDIALEQVCSEGFAGAQVGVRIFGQRVSARVRVPGVYNLYNGLAALGAAVVLGVARPVAAAALGGYRAAFGRVERFHVDGRDTVMLLVKNPTGFDQVIRTILDEDDAPDLLIALNDRIADGRDVSWIWDVDVEQLVGRTGAITVTGDRAAELALRLKYAGVAERALIEPDPMKAVAFALARGQGRLYILPTYTAMLELHTILAARAGAPRFWQSRRS